MSTLPTIALSVRQPWAWLIAHGGKDIENRTWPTSFRGRFLINAAKGCTESEYDGVRDWWSHQFGTNFGLPPLAALQRGGIVGEATLLDCVSASGSPWFEGPYGFVLSDMKPLPFRPCKGRLGFFKPDLSALEA